MKNFLLALMVVLTTCTLAVAQNQNPVAHDSISQAEPTLVVDTDTTDSIAKENVTATDTSNHSVLYSLSNAMEDVLIPIIAIISGLYVLLNQLFRCLSYSSFSSSATRTGKPAIALSNRLLLPDNRFRKISSRRTSRMIRVRKASKTSLRESDFSSSSGLLPVNFQSALSVC